MQLRSTDPIIKRLLKKGDIGVLPTDTIYGIVGSALDKKAVQKIYRLRKRNPKKPMIVLIGSRGDLVHFGIILDARTKLILKKIWPGRVSVILPIARVSARKDFRYLHRGSGTLAFRLPKPLWLRRLLKATGPLVAPSANTEGAAPSQTVGEAKKYFGQKIAFYADRGRLSGRPSTLVKIEKGALTTLRK